MNIEQERNNFEEAALAHFIQQLAAGAQISGDNGCEPTRESLFWRTDDGNYGVKMFNAAWWGWKTRALQPVSNFTGPFMYAPPPEWNDGTQPVAYLFQTPDGTKSLSFRGPESYDPKALAESEVSVYKLGFMSVKLEAVKS